MLKKFNESLEKERFFFDQDCSSHWYMIPVKLKDEWNRLNTSGIIRNGDDDEDDQDTLDEFESVFGEYSLGGGITHITFENPIK